MGGERVDPVETNEEALLVAMPLRHLERAGARAEAEGSVVLPAGGPGDLDDTLTGTQVLLIATEAGDAEVPAATWNARFEGRVAHTTGEPLPAGLPETWLEERAGSPAQSTRDGLLLDDDTDDGEDDGDPDDDMTIGPQSFFRVSALSPMPRADWIFSNELVPKQQRDGRTFVPRTPRLITLPD